MDMSAKGDSQYLSFNAVLGWILWLGVFSLLAPLFISDEKRAMMLNPPYLVGTVIICFINLAGIIFFSFYVASLFPVK